DLTAMLDGRLWTLPGGSLRFSMGAGVLDEDYSGNSSSVQIISGTVGRRTSYAFGELFLPLVGAEQNLPLVRRLELSLAARYTRFDDRSHPALHQEFGDNIDPKIGVLWAPVESLHLRGTYGTSFRAASLVQLDETSSFLGVLENAALIPSPSGPIAD